MGLLESIGRALDEAAGEVKASWDKMSPAEKTSALLGMAEAFAPVVEDKANPCPEPKACQRTGYCLRRQLKMECGDQDIPVPPRSIG